MGKFVDKLKQAKETVKTGVQKFEIEKNKAFTELVEKVATLELVLNDLIEKISGLQVAEKVEEKKNDKNKATKENSEKDNKPE